jgi:hypothetical protein
VDGNGLLASAPRNAGISVLLTAGGSIYVELSSAEGCPATCAKRVMLSRGGGASWSVVAPSFAGHPVVLLAADEYSRTLFGRVLLNAAESVGDWVYVRSTDEGATWRALPAVPAGLAPFNLLAAPDDTLYGELYELDGAAGGAALLGIHRLAPGSKSWTYVAPYPDDAGGPLHVAWDEHGHPVALWGGALQPIDYARVRLGLEHHTA